jgi:hypothetical protein
MDKKDNVTWLERTIRGIPIYLILLFIFTAILIGFFILIGMIIAEKYQIGEGKEYELFRDILTIILAILGLAIAMLGYGTYQIILHSAERKLGMWEAEFQNKMDIRYKDFLLYTNSMIYLNVGYSIWMIYKYDNKREQLEHAIFVTQKAYLSVQKLDEREKRYELLKCEILNNLSYYLAERKKEGDIELAKQYADFIMEKCKENKYPDNCIQWKDTATFVENRRYNIY